MPSRKYAPREHAKDEFSAITGHYRGTEMAPLQVDKEDMAMAWRSFHAGAPWMGAARLREPIQRWSTGVGIHCHEADDWPDDDGCWVKFEDHQANLELVHREREYAFEQLDLVEQLDPDKGGQGFREKLYEMKEMEKRLRRELAQAESTIVDLQDEVSRHEGAHDQ